MIKKFDLTYDEINAKDMFEKSDQTIKTAINNLEERYFKGRNLFRNNTRQSDLLFRWEIKNLLFLLIRLEIDNIFGSGKSSKSGISNLSIKKILASYDMINDNQQLRNYERWVLEESFSVMSSKDFVEDINGFSKAFTNFIVLIAKYYDLMPSDYLKRVVADINSFSREIVNHAISIQKFDKQTSFAITLDNYNLTADIFPGNQIRFTKINLENAVARAIISISAKIYDFDDDGCCQRKTELEASDEFNDSYKSIHAEHLEAPDNTKATRDERNINEYDRNLIRKKVDELMEAYWADEVNINRNEPENNIKKPSKEFYKHNSKEIIDDKICLLKKRTKEYVKSYCWLKLYLSGRLDKKAFEKVGDGISIFEEYERLRFILNKVKLHGHTFNHVLSEIEKEVWEQICDNKQGTKNEEIINEIIDSHIDEFRKDTDIIRVVTNNEFENIEKQNFENDILYGVRDNVENISKDSEDIIKNLLSMILKIESDKDEQEEKQLDDFLNYWSL